MAEHNLDVHDEVCSDKCLGRDLDHISNSDLDGGIDLGKDLSMDCNDHITDADVDQLDDICDKRRDIECVDSCEDIIEDLVDGVIEIEVDMELDGCIDDSLDSNSDGNCKVRCKKTDVGDRSVHDVDCFHSKQMAIKNCIIDQDNALPSTSALTLTRSATLTCALM